MLLINPQYEEQRAYLAQIAKHFEQEGEIIYGGRNLIKTLTMPNGETVNVKRYHKPAFINKLVYSLRIRQPKGMRAFLYPNVLLKKGIATAQPIAYIEERNALGLLQFSYFVSQQVPFATLLYHIEDLPDEMGKKLAQDLAKFTAHMHDEEVLHKDFSPGNILCHEQNGSFEFCLVDINRMYFGAVSMQQGADNLKRLWGSKSFITEVARNYARLRHFDEETFVNLTLEQRKRFWKRYTKKHGAPFEIDY